MLVTFVATLVVPLQFAVLFGMALSIVLHVFRQSNKVVVTQWVLQPEGFPLEQPPPKQLPSHQLTLLHVYGSLFFAAAKSMEEMLPAVGDATHAVVAINLRGKSEIGSTFMTVLQRYARRCRARQQADAGRRGSGVRDQLAKTGVLKLIGEENVFLATPQLGEALNQAVAAATAWLDKPPLAPAKLERCIEAPTKCIDACRPLEVHVSAESQWTQSVRSSRDADSHLPGCARGSPSSAR